MSRGDKDPVLRMFLNQETPSAVQVCENDGVNENSVKFGLHWIPRSIIGYVKKTENSNPVGLPHYEFSLPEWKIEQLGLWKFVP